MKLRLFATRGKDGKWKSFTWAVLTGRLNHRVLLTSRHHACESMATYALGRNDGELYWEYGSRTYGYRIMLSFSSCRLWIKMVWRMAIRGNFANPGITIAIMREKAFMRRPELCVRLSLNGQEDKLRVALDLHCPYIKVNAMRLYFLLADRDRRIGLVYKGFPAS